MKIIDPRMRVSGLLFWQVCVLAGVFGVLAGEYWLPGAMGGLGVGVVAGQSDVRKWLALGICFAVALFLGVRDKPLEPETPSWIDPQERYRVTGNIVSVTGIPDRRLRIMLEDVRPEGTDWTPVPGRVSWTWDQGTMPGIPRPLPGQTVRLTTRIRPAGGFANEGLEGAFTYWAERDVWFTAWSMADKGDVVLEGQGSYFATLRESWREAMVRALGGYAAAVNSFRSQTLSIEPGSADVQAKAMLPALIFGDRYGLDSASVERFTKAGLVHSLALSGQHLALAGSLAAVFIWLLGRGHASLYLRLPRRTLILVVGLPLAALYLWLGNAPPSLVRASLMMLFGAFLWLGKRPATLLDILFFAVLCFLVFRPRAVFDLSVRLSVLSVAGIALALPWLRRLRTFLEERIQNKCLRIPLVWAAMLLGTSLAVQITTLPVVLHTFGRLSIMFFLNLVWLPLLGAVVLPLAALGLFLLLLTNSAILVNIVFSLAALPAIAMLTLLDRLDHLAALPVLMGLKPTAWCVLGYAAALAATAMVFGRKKAPRTALPLTLCALVLLPSGALLREWENTTSIRHERVALRLLDVGQGQAVALEFPGGRMLIDGGGMTSPRLEPGRDVVAQALTVNRPPRLNAVMASHGDLDHARGLISILRLFAVDEVLYSALPLKSNTGDHAMLEEERVRRGIPLRSLRTGDVVDLGHGLALEIIHPPAKGRFSSNNGSLVVRLTQGGHGLALLCGDAEIPALKRILREGRDIRAEVLVIPHHGSASSLLPEFYDAVSPALALISCGAYNSFGFPRKEVTGALTERGIAIRTTALDGEIRLTWTNREARTLRTYRPGPTLP